MYVKNVVICDSQKQYSENLFQVLTKSKSPEVQFYLFHSMQDAEQFAKEKKIYALLTGEEYPKEKRRQIPAVRKFVLDWCLSISECRSNTCADVGKKS